jgi:hypothetical protein
MRQFYKCKYFKIQELVDKETYQKYGEGAWMHFNPVALKTLDGIHEFFDKYFGKPTKIIVNNWASGGNMDSRGFRSPNDNTGSKWGFHPKGNAFDFSVEGMTADSVRAEIIKHQNEPPFDEITALEINVTWVHMDFRNIDSDKIYLFKG